MLKYGRFGEFTACSNYPTCKYVKQKTIGVKCPECSEGEIIERRSKQGQDLLRLQPLSRLQVRRLGQAGAGEVPGVRQPVHDRKVAQGRPGLAVPQRGVQAPGIPRRRWSSRWRSNDCRTSGPVNLVCAKMAVCTPSNGVRRMRSIFRRSMRSTATCFRWRRNSRKRSTCGRRWRTRAHAFARSPDGNRRAFQPRRAADAALAYPLYTWHKQQHDTVRKRSPEFLKKVEAGEIDAPRDADDFLAGWLRDHMSVADRMMGAHVRNYERLHHAVARKPGRDKEDAAFANPGGHPEVARP